jgi:hypothetical protein
MMRRDPEGNSGSGRDHSVPRFCRREDGVGRAAGAFAIATQAGYCAKASTTLACCREPRGSGAPLAGRRLSDVVDQLEAEPGK